MLTRFISLAVIGAAVALGGCDPGAVNAQCTPADLVAVEFDVEGAVFYVDSTFTRPLPEVTLTYRNPSENAVASDCALYLAVYKNGERQTAYVSHEECGRGHEERVLGPGAASVERGRILNPGDLYTLRQGAALRYRFERQFYCQATPQDRVVVSTDSFLVLPD